MAVQPRGAQLPIASPKVRQVSTLPGSTSHHSPVTPAGSLAARGLLAKAAHEVSASDSCLCELGLWAAM